MRVVTDTGTIQLGQAEVMPTVGITDFSRRVTDDFGTTTVVERGFRRRLTARLGIASDQVDGVQRSLATLRATSANWIVDDSLAWLSVEGFYKDFELELAAGTLSYCKLTVEGLTETEVVADPGGDPAIAGEVSSFRLLQPVTIADASLSSSSVAESEYPEWAAGSTYAAGARVIRASTHRIYESIAGENVGNDPATSTGKWLDLGPTNRWAMFDQALGTATSAAGSVAVTLSAGSVTAVALLDVIGSSVRVQAQNYDRTRSPVDGTVTFLDLPTTTGAVTVTITGSSTVSIGTLLIGKVVGLGTTEASPTAGISDFSRKVADDFGNVTPVERAWAKRMSARTLIRTDAVDIVANRIAKVRATPSLWIGGDGVQALTVYGFFRDFSIEIGDSTSQLSLSIEGLSKASPSIEGVSKQDLIDRVAEAKAGAEAALALLADIASNAILSSGEKAQLGREVSGILAEKPFIAGQADAVLVSRAAYDAACDALLAYLESLTPPWNELFVNTPIDPAIFTARFSEYYVERSALLMAIADAAANSAATGDGNRIRYSPILPGRTAGYEAFAAAGATVVETPAPFALNGRTYFQRRFEFTGNGQSVSVTTSYADRIPVRPGERVSVQVLVTVGAFNNFSRLVEVKLVWLDGTGALITTSPIATALSQGVHAAKAFATAPAGAFTAVLEVGCYNTTAGAGLLDIAITDPMLSGAGSLQTKHPSFTPGPSNEPGADVTSAVTGPSSVILNYEAGGVTPQAGQLPNTISLRLIRSGVDVTEAATWAITSAPSGWSGSISNVAGRKGQLTTNSLTPSVAEMRVTAAYQGGQPRPHMVTFEKKTAAPPTVSSGGGASGGTTAIDDSFVAVTSTSGATPTVVSDELSVIVGAAGVVSLRFNVDHGLQPIGYGEYAQTLGLKTQWWNGSAWIDNFGYQLSEPSAYSFNEQPPGTDTPIETEGAGSNNVNWPGNVTKEHAQNDLTPGSSQKYRMVAYIAAGVTTAAYLSGSLIVTGIN